MTIMYKRPHLKVLKDWVEKNIIFQKDDSKTQSFSIIFFWSISFDGLKPAKQLSQYLLPLLS